MGYVRAIAALSLLSQIIATEAEAQNFGACNRGADTAIMILNQEVQRKVQIVYRYNYPPQVIQAHLDIIYYSQQDSLRSIQIGHSECVNGFRPAQQIVDGAMTVFTAGLNRALPSGMTRIDLSEIASGTPFGGPGAIVPEIREGILGNDNGTISNIIRNPIQCLTFQTSC